MIRIDCSDSKSRKRRRIAMAARAWRRTSSGPTSARGSRVITRTAIARLAVEQAAADEVAVPVDQLDRVARLLVDHAARIDRLAIDPRMAEPDAARHLVREAQGAAPDHRSARLSPRLGRDRARAAP